MQLITLQCGGNEYFVDGLASLLILRLCDQSITRIWYGLLNQSDRETTDECMGRGEEATSITISISCCLLIKRIDRFFAIRINASQNCRRNNKLVNRDAHSHSHSHMKLTDPA